MIVRFLLCFAVSVCVWGMSPTVRAQNSIPEMPDPIRNLESEGAQVRYMGRDHGFDSWISVKNGQEQYFYVPPGGTGFVMGVLFDQKGRVVTIDQVQRLRDKGDSLVESLTGADALNSINESADRQEFSSPSERLFHDTEQSNWVPMGYAEAPVMYAIIDPQCPHCHAMMQDIRQAGYLERGDVQLRLIPVGFIKDSMEKAAFLLAAPNPQERFLASLDGDADALPVRKDINTQGVERNMAYMQGWKLDVTPMLIYRGKDGKVKIVRGRPNDLSAVLADLAPAR